MMKNYYKETTCIVPITEISKDLQLSYMKYRTIFLPTQIVSRTFRVRNANCTLRTQADFATAHANKQIHDITDIDIYLYMTYISAFFLAKSSKWCLMI